MESSASTIGFLMFVPGLARTGRLLFSCLKWIFASGPATRMALIAAKYPNLAIFLKK